MEHELSKVEYLNIWPPNWQTHNSTPMEDPIPTNTGKIAKVKGISKSQCLPGTYWRIVPIKINPK